jgi:hypothetical protein
VVGLDKKPIADVAVFDQSSKCKGNTDSQGVYGLTLSEGKHTLMFYHPDFAYFTQDVRVIANNTRLYEVTLLST